MKKSAPPDQSRPRKATLRGEDETLWTHVARQVTPARRMKPRVHPAADGKQPQPMMLLAPETNRAVAERSAASPTPRQATGRMPPPLNGLDKKKVRRIASGRIDIDARLDLHGLRQNEAHAELQQFLVQCQSRDHRIVLVITGKGGPADAFDAGDVIPTRDRGVLKRNVPRWLAEPELRAIVVGYTDAHARHGGSGAIYVHLRSRSR